MDLRTCLAQVLALGFPGAGLLLFVLVLDPLFSLLHLTSEGKNTLEGLLSLILFLLPLFAWFILAQVKGRGAEGMARQIMTSLQWGFIVYYVALVTLILLPGFARL
jgi:hypothetical protein